MTSAGAISTAHRRARDALDLAHDRLDAAERHLTAALDSVDDDISRELQTVLDHLGQGGAA